MRFFSTSLLIVSEGCLTAHRNRHDAQKHNNSDGEEEEDDFEEEDEEMDEHLDEEYDEDYEAEEDMDSLYKTTQRHYSASEDNSNEMLSLVHEDTSSSVDSNSQLTRQATISAATQSSTVDSRYVAKHYVCNRDHRRRSPVKGPEFDVRMIDFAHTSFSSNSAADGFTLGLDNLIRLLSNIRSGTSVHSASKQSSTKKRRRSSQTENQQQPQNGQHHKSLSRKKDACEEVNGKCSDEIQPVKADTREPFLLNEETVMDPFHNSV